MEAAKPDERPRTGLTEEEIAGSVAIVGMDCRFPGAPDLDRFWENLRDGVESITFFDREELLAAGIDPQLVDHPDFVPAKPVLDDVDRFDAPFFGFNPREAEILDPQHRLFLETAWRALERSGHAVDGYPGWIGVFAGVSFPSYWAQNLARRADVMAAVGSFQALLANDRDYFATRTSYKLDLRGPSVNVQSACSTSLVAVHLACQSLLDHQCDVALAGGSRINLPRANGYVYQEGGIVSPDGHCRPFDARAAGSLFGDGVGAVVLKRLADALDDGDTIDAVIRGSAYNNDGADKVGYTAPSVEGQAEVIEMAQAIAGVDPETVSYVECHGSGTPLGDPIEVAALTEVFRRSTERRGFCAIGSVKSNFGHLESAAGIAGLIKTVLALRHREIPPSLHVEEPNPRIDWETSPFRVATDRTPWEAPNGAVRRAGVSSFGIGGTNVHVVLDEAPGPPPSGPSRPVQVLAISARTPTALEAATDRLAATLGEVADEALPDVAYTLLRGRRAFEHRRALVCTSREDAVAALEGRSADRLLEAAEAAVGERPIFLVSGLGDHYPGMGAGLYRNEPVFREEIDRAAEILRPVLDEDVRELLGLVGGSGAGTGRGTGPDLRAMLGRAETGTAEDGPLSRVRTLHPALFAVEHALARLWMSYGVEPGGMIGYSLGEYVAACVAGTLTLEDALTVVAERARLVEEAGAGAMVAVPLPAEELQERLDGRLALAAVNGPRMAVAAGPEEEVAALEERLGDDGLVTRRLAAPHPFHTPLLGDAAEALGERVAGIALQPPEIPFVSNVTGTWIGDDDAVDPAYWSRHLTSPVRFADGVETLLEEGHRIFLEIGPGRGLGSLVHQHPASDGVEGGVRTISSLPARFDGRSEEEHLADAVARLWLAGAGPGEGFWVGETRRRLHLPTYPFERSSYWIDPPAPAAAAARPAPARTEAPAGSGAGSTAGAGSPEAAPSTASHERPRVRSRFVAPQGETEEALARIWSDILGVDGIGARDDFFELGGNSLIVPQVLFKVREVLGPEVSVATFLEAPTVSRLAEMLERMKRGELEQAAGRPDDLADAVVLDPEVTAAEPRAPHPPDSVFLTGGTGFFGAFLLSAVLDRVGGPVYCLARADDREGAARRLEENLRYFGLWREGVAERLVPVVGDLSRERFGLEPERFEEIAGRVDAVFHAGAWVNFTYPYEALAPANVFGTQEALRLAGAVRTKPFHMISSISVFGPGAVGDDGIAFEEADLSDSTGLFAGYGESKWVAEGLVGLARERGIPATIHRPGVIGGSSENGAGNPRDLVWNLIKGCIQLGAAPRGIGVFDAAPVDWVARAVVHASLQERSWGRAFHYPNPEPTSWDAAFDAVRQAGYRVRPVDYGAWRRELLAAVREGRDNALAAFLPLLPRPANEGGGTGDGEVVEGPFLRGDDDANTREALEGSGIVCARLDEGLLARYLEHFVETGFIEPPG